MNNTEDVNFLSSISMLDIRTIICDIPIDAFSFNKKKKN